MRLSFPEEESSRLFSELKKAYRELTGEELSDERIVKVLEGKETLYPMTERLVKILSRLGEIYNIMPHKAKRLVGNNSQT